MATARPDFPYLVGWGDQRVDRQCAGRAVARRLRSATRRPVAGVRTGRNRMSLVDHHLVPAGCSAARPGGSSGHRHVLALDRGQGMDPHQIGRGSILVIALRPGSSHGRASAAVCKSPTDPAAGRSNSRWVSGQPLPPYGAGSSSSRRGITRVEKLPSSADLITAGRPGALSINTSGPTLLCNADARSSGEKATR